jgi:hypothetical protein
VVGVIEKTLYARKPEYQENLVVDVQKEVKTNLLKRRAFLLCRKELTSRRLTKFPGIQFPGIQKVAKSQNSLKKRLFLWMI